MGNYTAAVPVIATTDVLKTVLWYETTLGFEREWIWGEPPVYAGLKAGDALLYVTDDAATATAIRERMLAPDVFLWVTEIEAFYARHKANGAAIVEELSARPWGVRQYVIRDPNGYRLKVAEQGRD